MPAFSARGRHRAGGEACSPVGSALKKKEGGEREQARSEAFVVTCKFREIGIRVVANFSCYGPSGSSHNLLFRNFLCCLLTPGSGNYIFC